MESHATLLALGVGLFVTNDIDDIFALVGFFSDPRFKPRQVALGQLIGVAAPYAASVVFSLLSLVVSPAWIGFLGVLMEPIARGDEPAQEHQWRCELKPPLHCSEVNI